MEDFRCFDDSTLWILIILAFVLFFGKGSCGSFGSGCGGFDNLFDGCGNNTWIWIIIAILVWWFLSKGSCGGGIFRSDVQ